MAELNMDHYDDEEDEGEGVRGVFGNTNPGMAYYGANEEDPYIQLAGVEDADSEAEDYQISSDDFVLLAARNEDDVSHLEVGMLAALSSYIQIFSLQDLQRNQC